MKIRAYTFRTNPFFPAMQDNFGDVFVFGKMRRDFERFKDELRSQTPSLVLGLAKSWNKYSYVEGKALNQFNKSKTVEKGQPLEMELFMPPAVHQHFKVNQRGSDSFCNWAMYRISSFIANEEIGAKHAFFHCHEADISIISKLFATSDPS